MALFLGTLLIVILCCLAMGIGLLLRGRPLAGGCGAEAPAIASAARAARHRRTRRTAECPNRGDH